MDLSSLACKRVRELTPYQSARRIGGVGRVYLNANESPVSAEFSLDTSDYNRYPDCQPEEILEAYASYAGNGVTSDMVMVSRGSDEAIGLLVRTFCEPGKENIIICPPTYGMYSIAAETNGIGVVKIAPCEDFQPDAAAISSRLAQGDAKVVFLCSPNNPTGTILDRDILLEILKAAEGKALVVVDEAYIEFCPENSACDLLKSHKNLVITRTLSKAFALAGLRCGFTIADPEIIGMLLKVIDPYPICAPVAQIAVQALSEKGLKITAARVEELNESRTAFVELLKQMKRVKKVHDAMGNYVLAEFDDGDDLFASAKKAGFILRDFGDKPRLKGCVRITVGTKAEMADLAAFMKEWDK